MTTDEALAALREIVRGIDRDETESADGWWETSTAAEFGRAKLAELESLVRSLCN